jgi:hypothetical protein
MNSNSQFSVIAALDLDPIKVKLMHQESGEGWSLEHATAIEFEYRRFLYLMKLFPHEQTAPLFDVDIFWHYHILDTMKYAADCEQIFGYFLHHFPYIGLRGEEDEAAHERVGARMHELYEATFGEACIRPNQDLTGSSAGANQAAWSSATPTATAWSSAIAKTAWSSAIAKSAWSSAIAKTAWSSAIAKTAWSSAIGKAADNHVAAANTAWSSANAASPEQGGHFYSERPRLAVAA